MFQEANPLLIWFRRSGYLRALALITAIGGGVLLGGVVQRADDATLLIALLVLSAGAVGLLQQTLP